MTQAIFYATIDIHAMFRGISQYLVIYDLMSLAITGMAIAYLSD